MNKSAELPSRGKLAYAEQGEPSGVPVLLLHGVTDSWRSFAPMLAHLPRSMHAFALSQRGHGDSDRPTAGYAPHDFAADLAAFMDAVGLEAAIIVGHSMSASIAQRFALDFPERTLALTLVGSFFAGWRGSPAAVELWDSVVSTLTDPIDPGFVREFQESTIARPVPPTFLDTVVQESLKVPARVWRAVFESFLEADFSAQLGQIQVPTLIVWGDRDAICPRGEQEALAAAIPGARLVVYPEAGHAPHWERPERFAADLVAFTGRVVG
jgi:pimeloyl-ACP methyl ester carboxylesterase